MCKTVIVSKKLTINTIDTLIHYYQVYLYFAYLIGE